MNRWMTARDLPGKCGFLGANGLADGAALADPASSEPRAILPRPTPQSRRKWRRATVFGSVIIRSLIWATFPCRRGRGGCLLLFFRFPLGLDTVRRLANHRNAR